MPDISQAREPRLLALDQLLSRRSVGPLHDPAPQGADLDLILDAGLRAPDHGRLRPWRFVVIRGEARFAFGEKLTEAAARRDPANAAALGERAAGAAAMNMLNAIHLLGYGGMWVTGANTYDANVNALLGFQAPSRLVGFVSVGTLVSPPTQAVRPDRSAHVADWTP